MVYQISYKPDYQHQQFWLSHQQHKTC